MTETEGDEARHITRIAQIHQNPARSRNIPNGSEPGKI
jgi:hypothetical protein